MKTNLINKNAWRYVDWFLVVLICVLVAFSLVSIANVTADPFTGDESTISDYMANLNLGDAQKQLMFFGIGAGVMFVMLLINYQSVRNITEYVYWICIALLVAVLLFGSENKGAKGWFMIGTFGFQPAEYCKIGIILVLAKLLADKTQGHDEGITKFRDILPSLWHFLLPFVLIAMQPDFGTAVVYVFIFVIMLFMSKTHWRVMVILIVLALAMLPLIWLVLEDYQKIRILSFFMPNQFETEDLANAQMQVNQAQMAIGSGGMWGKGLFAPGSLSQLDYVPEKHNDFIFAVTVEAFGFMGGVVVLILYFLLIARTFMLALRARDDFGSYIIVGVAAMTLFHVFENIGMNIGLLPVTGIPLPFFSYGGSSLVTNMMAYGIVLSVDMRRTKWPSTKM